MEIPELSGEVGQTRYAVKEDLACRRMWCDVREVKRLTKGAHLNYQNQP